jgi:flavodoxin
MKVWILHDTRLGNGELIAETMQKALREHSAEVQIGHVKDIDPKKVANDKPDVIVVGAAIRMFFSSPSSKKWIRNLKKELNNINFKVPFGAVFLTHAMPTKGADIWGKRYQRVMVGSEFIKVHPEWLSGRCRGQEGPPPEEGVLEFFESFANSVPSML